MLGTTIPTRKMMHYSTLSRYSLFLFLLVVMLFIASGCQPVQMPDGAEPAADDATATGVSTTIQFAFKAGDQDLACGQEYTGLGTGNTTATMNNLRFYVSNIHLVNSSGNAVPLTLEQDGLWQTENTALLDFEDATAGCTESGTPDMNSVVVGTIPEDDYTAIAFELGVPYALNHQDVTLAPSPLNVASMWWNWRGGYKFVRVDMMSGDAEPNPWLIHLGSVGCQSADKIEAPAAPCARPNLAEIHLADFDPNSNVIVADLATLLANVNIGESTPKPPGCMSGPDDPDCTDLIPAFGLVQDTGACAEGGCSSQAFFRVE